MGLSRASASHVSRFIIWMGHDSFPCTANTAIVDYDGVPKPAALALRDIFRTNASPSDR